MERIKSTGTKLHDPTDMKIKEKARLRELAPGGAREPGGGNHSI